MRRFHCSAKSAISLGPDTRFASKLAFTFIELSLVITSITILATLLFPGDSRNWGTNHELLPNP
jgi:hypothetical protein